MRHVSGAIYLGKGPSSTSARAGLVVLAIFVFVWAAIILVATYKGVSCGNLDWGCSSFVGPSSEPSLGPLAAVSAIFRTLDAAQGRGNTDMQARPEQVSEC